MLEAELKRWAADIVFDLDKRRGPTNAQANIGPALAGIGHGRRAKRVLSRAGLGRR